MLDVGHDTENGFRAVAISLLDAYLSNKTNGLLWEKLLTSHVRYFPGQQSFSPVFASVGDQLRQMMRQLTMTELVRTLAYTLRQLSVDELCAQPVRYQSAFVNVNTQSQLEDMRQTGVPLDACAMAALAASLGFTMEIHLVEPHKDLRARVRYAEGENAQVVMQRGRGDTYQPYVVHRDHFAHLHLHSVRLLSPVVAEETSHYDLSDIMQKISLDNSRLFSEANTLGRRLHTMLSAGELSLDDLVALYIASTSMHSSRYIGTEHGNQQFFETLNSDQNSTKMSLQFDEKTTAPLASNLVIALAQAVGLGQLSPTQLFDFLEKKQEAFIRPLLP